MCHAPRLPFLRVGTSKTLRLLASSHNLHDYVGNGHDKSGMSDDSKPFANIIIVCNIAAKTACRGWTLSLADAIEVSQRENDGHDSEE
jgi:hypothetical protein